MKKYKAILKDKQYGDTLPGAISAEITYNAEDQSRAEFYADNYAETLGLDLDSYYEVL